MSEDEKKDSNTALAQPIRAIVGRKTGLAARKAEIIKQTNVDVGGMPNRLTLVFDDSGSMGGYADYKDKLTKIEQAKSAVEGFLKSCNPNDTAIAVYNFTGGQFNLTTDFLSLNLLVQGFGTGGSTPLYGTLANALKNEKMTRAIVFSDGQPTDNPGTANYYLEDGAQGQSCYDVIEEYVNAKIPIDTVAIGQDSQTLKDISERTGGVYLHFEDGTTFAQAFKYLTPAYRALLMNPDVKARIERGEKI